MEEVFFDRGVRVRIASKPDERLNSFSWTYEVEPVSPAARKAFSGDYARRHGIQSEEHIPQAEPCLSEAGALEHARRAALQAVDLAFADAPMHKAA
jgi:hypothetical protein